MDYRSMCKPQTWSNKKQPYSSWYEWYYNLQPILLRPDSFDKLNVLNSCKLCDFKKLPVISNEAHLTKKSHVLGPNTKQIEISGICSIDFSLVWLKSLGSVPAVHSFPKVNLSMYSSDLDFLNVFKYVLKLCVELGF